MKRLFLLAIVAVVGVATWRWQSSRGDHDATTSDARLVQDRLWIDHLPRNERDTIQIFVALTEQPLGAFQQTSAWKGSFEVFRYELQGNKLRVVYPQNGDKETVSVDASACRESGMDYCLEVKGSSRGVKRYYSRKGWEIDSLASEQAKVAELAGSAR